MNTVEYEAPRVFYQLLFLIQSQDKVNIYIYHLLSPCNVLEILLENHFKEILNRRKEVHV